MTIFYKTIDEIKKKLPLLECDEGQIQKEEKEDKETKEEKEEKADKVEESS